MDAQTLRSRLFAIRDLLGPWWQMPLAFFILLIPAACYGVFYLGQGMDQIISVMLFPFALRVGERGERPFRYLIWSLIISILGLWLQTNLFVFLGLGFGFLFLLEFYFGKIGWLPALLLLLMTPFLSSWLTSFTFPLQLYQSKVLGELLGGMGWQVEVHGNRFLLHENWFAVDAACLGIHILSIGFFITVLILAIFQANRYWTWWEIGLWLILAAILSWVANFARMLILVIFQSPPSTLGHELTGLLSIGLFIALPIYGLIWLRVNWGRQAENNLPKTIKIHLRGKPKFLPHIWSLLLAILVIWKFWTFTLPFSKSVNHLSLTGHTSKVVHPGIVQFSNSNSLVYLKAPETPWRADHNPSICWTGGGFKVEQIHLDTLANKEVFKAILVNQPDSLYTAWWYDSGKTQTCHQLEWRKWALMDKQKFYLINVSKGTESALDSAASKLLDDGIAVFGAK
ncbi:MAG: exosortase N [Bacteroidia bacterium]|nr:exosortase N [Bacteroidia bacterium]